MCVCGGGGGGGGVDSYIFQCHQLLHKCEMQIRHLLTVVVTCSGVLSLLLPGKDSD